MLFRKLLLLSIFIFSAPAYAANQCSDVIKLSLVSSTEYRTEKQFEENAAEFCRRYSKNQAAANSGGAQVGYAGFTFGGSAASSNAKSIAETVCRSSDNSSLRDDAYDRLVETIAPQAYSSYDRCVANSASFSVEVGDAATPTYAPLFINFTPQTSGEYALIKVASDPSVKCDLTEDRKMETAGRLFVSCRRTDATVSAGSINIINLAGGGQNLSIPWAQYNEAGVPVNVAAQFVEANAQLAEMRRAFAGVVMPFESDACPPLFTQYVPAQGRFIRGIDPAGTLDVQREPGNVQDDSIMSHTHLVKAYTKDHRASETGNNRETVVRTGGAKQVPTGASGSSETRPKNVALLYCQFSD